MWFWQKKEEDEEKKLCTFEEVLRKELDSIAVARGLRLASRDAGTGGEAEDPCREDETTRRLEDACGGIYRRAHRERLVGLAFSGGGIRSATFNLGVLQGLAHLRLLRWFDYLSTVSGGGYIGSWLSAWIHRKGLARAEEQLDPNRARQLESGAGAEEPGKPKGVYRREEPEPIRFLRDYSNYLTPRRGLLSADTWTSVAIYLRNLLLNLTILLPALTALLIVPRVWVGLSTKLMNDAGWTVVGGMVGFLGIAVTLITGNLIYASYEPTEEHPDYTKPGWVQAGIVFLLLLASWLLGCLLVFTPVPSKTVILGSVAAPILKIPPDRLIWWWALLGGVGYVLLWIYGWILGPILGWWGSEKFAEKARQTRKTLRQSPVRTGGVEMLRASPLFLYAFFAGAAGGLCLYGVWRALRLVAERVGGNEPALWLVVGLGTPLVVGVFKVTVTLHIGLVGQEFRTEVREWWGRLGGLLFVYTLSWLVLFGVALYAPLLQRVIPWDSMWARAISGGAALGWLATTIGGVLAGRHPATGTPEADWRLELLARVAPPVFLVGLLVLLSFGVHTALARQAGTVGNEFTYTLTVTNKGPEIARGVTLTDSLPDGTELASYTPTGGCQVEGAHLTCALGNLEPGATVRVRLVTRVTVAGTILNAAQVSSDTPDPNTVNNESQPAAATVWQVDSRADLEVSKSGLTGSFSAGWALVSDYLAELDRTRGWKLFLYWFLAPLAVALWMSLRVDINAFSMHDYYRNRLVRCYLGASNPERWPHPFTGFDVADDLPLSDLQPAKQKEGAAAGAYPILNAALNITQGQELAWQQRKAASFVFTPRFCGYLPSARMVGDEEAEKAECQRGGYRSTKSFATKTDLTEEPFSVGTAMALSGAAASPNMGYHTAPALAFLMTVFNVRLGCWLGNPRREQWQRKGPAIGLLYLLSELLGWADADSNYVYVSDGGHFENLAIYELVRRRCQLIVACDAEQDAEMTFSGLGNAIEKCREDFGIDIEIDYDALRPKGEPGERAWSQRHCAVGTIHYEMVDPGCQPGTLLYLKASLTGNEPADVLRYARQNREFPHQTTADQWFDESQFESYRELGWHVVESLTALLEEEKKAPGKADGLLGREVDDAKRKRLQEVIKFWRVGEEAGKA